jgi:hypothetical protein
MLSQDVQNLYDRQSPQDIVLLQASTKTHQVHDTISNITMKRRSLEHGIGITIVLDEGEDEEAIPHAFRRFLVHSVANGKLEALFADPIFSQHIAFSEAVTGKGA